MQDEKKNLGHWIIYLLSDCTVGCNVYSKSSLYIYNNDENFANIASYFEKFW